MNLVVLFKLLMLHMLVKISYAIETNSSLEGKSPVLTTDKDVLDLNRFEEYCEEKIHDVYVAIKEFNNFNYEKNQEIQYLSYNEEKQHEILKQSNERKENIKSAFNRMHWVCDRSENKRDAITRKLNPLHQPAKEFYVQPQRIPKCWYDMHNLETIVLQLFTPKVATKTYYDENENMLRMRPSATPDSTRKTFLPLPDEYVSSKPTLSDNANGSSLILEQNHPKTTEPLTTDKLRNNPFQQFTYSTSADIQQIIVHYQFKYWEYEVRDLTRKVFYFSKLLKTKKRTYKNANEISGLENELANSLNKLQSATIEMERNRVTPEIINLYNAENAAHDLLPHSKFISKLTENKRVITMFNPSDAIISHQLADAGKRTDVAVGQTDQPKLHREDFLEALEWDRNWEWDF